jgi:hypothetical protein
MFGLKGRDTFNKPTSDFGDIIKKTGKWWLKFFPYILGVFITIGICILGYVWYTYLYHKELSVQEKQEYIDKKNKEVTFKKEKFNEVKENILFRKEEYQKPRQEYVDIFYRTEVIDIEDEKDAELTNDTDVQ